MADVSVIVPLYNSEPTILRCLRSIAAQSTPPTEIIVVDDCSADNGPAVVEQAAIDRVRLVRLPANRGPGAARNAGVELASSEWVAFLDADSYWEPGFLEAMTGAVTALAADFGAGGGYRIMGRTRQRYPRLLDGPRRVVDMSSTYWRTALRFPPAVPSSSIVRRDLFRHIGGFPQDARTGEDMTLFARLWLNGRFAFVNEPLFVSVQLSSSLTAAPRSYRDLRLMLVRIGAVLLRAIAARRPGTAWFVLAYARMVFGRHIIWLTSRLRWR